MLMLPLVLAALVAVGLLVLDFVFMRRTDRAIAEEDEAKAARSKRGAEPTLKPEMPPMPPLVRVGMGISMLFGWLNLPATLAPVILVALAMQARPIGGDGTTALIGILVAAFSMSASMKAMRVSDYLGSAERRFRAPLRQSVAYFLGWTVLVLCLLVVARAPSGKVALVVYSYVAALVAFAALLFVVQRRADTWMTRSDSA